MVSERVRHDGGRLARTFVDLADTLTSDYDALDFLDRLVADAVDLFLVESAGVLLTDQRGGIQLVASSSQDIRVIELYQLQSGQGPCLDAIATGAPVREPDLAAHADRWPNWAAVAVDAGYSSVYATPMRLRDQTIGALNLFGTTVSPLSDEDAALVQAMADLATIGILHERVFREAGIVTEQLQTALNSRVVIEQAKGVLAGRRGLDMNEAYRLLRAHSQNTNTRLTEVARGVIEGTIRTGDLRGAPA